MAFVQGNNHAVGTAKTEGNCGEDERMIIGIAGKAGAGKSTLAKIVCGMMWDNSAFRVERRGFADPVKEIARTFFGWNGEKDDNGRRLLQDIGMAGRLYDEDIWVNKMRPHLSDDICTVIDDVRFNNEAMLCHRRGTHILISGRSDDLGENSGHASEKGIDIQPDFRIVNDGDLVALESQAREIVR
ncbi:MAG: hypothetical protein WC373_17330, partial [Smithella sp.]